VARRLAGGRGAPGSLRFEVCPLRGGLQAAAVARVRALAGGPGAPAAAVEFVVKRLAAGGAREAAVYEALADGSGPTAAPRLLHVQRDGDDCHLYLEYVRPWRRWPWADPAVAGLALEQLARVHTDLAGTGLAAGAAWDYEAELQASAAATLEALEAAAAGGGVAGLRPAVPAARRVLAALPALRRQLLEAAPAGLRPGLIHGDVHPGNVVVVRRAGALRAVLLDWGRARRGAPLEDVSSWLQSLGLWEREAARRHDTLFRRYLTARGLPDRLDRELRDAYWFAGAANALAGALRYQLAVGTGWGNPPPRARADAARAARVGLRVLRRADACWRR
jgi:aminoglycoside phosphotransferase (APT) family kinase protein